MTVAAITILFNWFKVLSYFRGFRGAGVYTRLVLQIVYEIKYFLLVWTVVLLGFANAYYMLFRGNDPEYDTDPDQLGHFYNLGLAFVSVFKGSTGGGIDLHMHGDVFPFPPSPNGTQLYDLQFFLFIFFTLTCQILLLNMLIAQMASVFVEMTRSSAAQYRIDKAKLLIALEGLFLRRDKQTKSERWLHVIAPVYHDLWERHALNETIELKNHMDSVQRKLHLEITELRTQMDEIVRQNAKITKLIEDRSSDLLRNQRSDHGARVVTHEISQDSLEKNVHHHKRDASVTLGNAQVGEFEV